MQSNSIREKYQKVDTDFLVCRLYSTPVARHVDTKLQNDIGVRVSTAPLGATVHNTQNV